MRLSVWQHAGGDSIAAIRSGKHTMLLDCAATELDKIYLEYFLSLNLTQWPCLEALNSAYTAQKVQQVI